MSCKALNTPALTIWRQQCDFLDLWHCLCRLDQQVSKTPQIQIFPAIAKDFLSPGIGKGDLPLGIQDKQGIRYVLQQNPIIGGHVGQRDLTVLLILGKCGFL